MWIDLLIALLAVMLAAGLPVWPWSRAWGYRSTASIAILLLIVIYLTVQRVF